MKIAISTEGRIFVARLVRDLRARERAGAALLAPGTSKWRDAFYALGCAMGKSNGPVKAGKLFKAARQRLLLAQKDHACFVNCFMHRKRSGFFQTLTYEVAQHPLTNDGYEGIIVRSYNCFLKRNGVIAVSKEGTRLAFLSWHALARLYERSDVDIFTANGVVAMCGIAGLLLREATQHKNGGINLATGDVLCTGVLRCEEGKRFFDVVTALPPNELHKAMWEQGNAVTNAVVDYIKGDNADPRGWGNNIPVLPFRNFDYVSRTLEKKP
jgi:hypothetical protein